MADEVEQVLERELVLAKAAYEAAEEQLAAKQTQVDEMLAQARGNKAERQDEVKRLEKMLKIHRREPLAPVGSKAKNNGAVPDLPDELVEQVYATAVRLAEEDADGGFSIYGVQKELPGVSYEKARLAVGQLCKEDRAGNLPRIRKAGKRTGGVLYKLDQAGS